MSARLRLPLLVLTALLAAGGIGLSVVGSPELLHVDLALSFESFAILMASLGLCGLVLAIRPLGLALLLVFVYLNLSQILVRYHDLPSLLQMLVLPLLLVAWTGRGEAERQHLFRQGLTQWLLLYLAVLLFSTTLARDREVADQQVAEMAKAFLLYLLVPLLVSTRALLRASQWILLSAGAFLSGLGLWQVASGDFSNEMGGLARVKMAQIYGDVFEPRIAGPLGDPNFFAQILLVLVPIALWLGWGEGAFARKALAFGLGALILAATVFSYSRGAALVVALLLLLSLLQHGIRPRTVAIALGVGAGLLLALPADFRERLTTVQELLPGETQELHPDSSIEKRKLYMRVASRIFLHHPLVGVGVANYGAHFDENAEVVGSVARDYVDPAERHFPHNLYLEIAAETGLLGLGVFAAAIATAFLYLRRAHGEFRARGDVVAAGWVRGFALALLGYLLSSLFLHGHFARYLWLWLGFVAALECLARSPGGKEPGLP